MNKIIIMSCLALMGCQSTSNETGASAKPSNWDTEWATVWDRDKSETRGRYHNYSSKTKMAHLSPQMVIKDLETEYNTANSLKISYDLEEHHEIRVAEFALCKEVTSAPLFQTEYIDNNNESEKATVGVNLKDNYIYIDDFRKIHASNIERVDDSGLVRRTLKIKEVRCNFDFPKVYSSLVNYHKTELNKLIKKKQLLVQKEAAQLAKQAEKEKALTVKRKANAHFYVMKETAQTIATVNYCEENFLLSNNAAKSYNKELIDELKIKVGKKYDKNYLNDQYVKTKAIVKYADYTTLSISCGAMQDAYDAKNGKVF